MIYQNSLALLRGSLLLIYLSIPQGYDFSLIDFFIYYAFIETVASRKVIAIKSVLSKYSAGYVASKSALAHNIKRF